MNPSPLEVARAMSVAERWAAQDPDRTTRAETDALLNLVPLGDEQAARAIVDQFGRRLGFGTAGLRGELGAGPGRMNRVVVQQTTAGFAEFLRQREGGSADARLSVVIGYDGRINSTVFARDAAEVFAGAGIEAILLPEPLPTPITAFAVRFFAATAGVMITASHNPPRDNGYKFYLGGADEGSQVAPPDDAAIAALIDRAAARPLSDLPRSTDVTLATHEVVDAYVTATAACIREQLPEVPPELQIVYTAMHGVGSRVTQRVFAEAGLPSVTVVDEQDQPDGRFPTVDYPNPEEPGALDLAYARANELGAELVIAHDPDADRLAVAVPDATADQGFRRLSGNQLGLVLGWQAAERFRESGRSAGALACTNVSSPALRAVADAYGLDYVETLSGFKWVSRVPNLVFGFEEALGYLTRPDLVRDKDGISASADLLALCLRLKADGKTLWDHLNEATARFGCFASAQVTVRLSSSDAVSALSTRIRNAPPAAFGTIAVQQITDMLLPGAAPVPANVLKFDLEDGSRIMIRPSGTEPKLKLYLDTFSDEGEVAECTRRAEEKLALLREAARTMLEV